MEDPTFSPILVLGNVCRGARNHDESKIIMIELPFKLSSISDWPNLVLLLIGVCYFVFGVARKKSP